MRPAIRCSPRVCCSGWGWRRFGLSCTGLPTGAGFHGKSEKPGSELTGWRPPGSLHLANEDVMPLLGADTLQGIPLVVEPVGERLVPTDALLM